MTIRKYLVLLGVVLFGSLGDVALSHGMRDFVLTQGSITPAQFPQLVRAVFTPWVGIAIVLLLGFMTAYMTALSWADLTYVLPATSVGYIIMALLANFFLHEDISPARWAGIVLISAGVGFVTRGPAHTTAQVSDDRPPTLTSAGEPE